LDAQFEELVTKYADVTHEPQDLPPHRGIFDHKIRLINDYPKRRRCNRPFVPPYEEIKRQTGILKQGLVHVSNSPYTAPIVMVRKLDGYIRVCVDYRALNECTSKDSCPLPRIDELVDKLRNAKCMTHLDLRSAYTKARMSDTGPQDDSIVATAFQGLAPNGAS